MATTPERKKAASFSSVATPVSDNPKVLNRQGSSMTGNSFSTPRTNRGSSTEPKSLKKLPSFTSPSHSRGPIQRSQSGPADYSPPSLSSSPPNEPFAVPITPSSRDNSPPGSVDPRFPRLPASQTSIQPPPSAATVASPPSQTANTAAGVMSSSTISQSPSLNLAPPPPQSGAPPPTFPPPSIPPPPVQQNQYQAYQPFQQTRPEYGSVLNSSAAEFHSVPPPPANHTLPAPKMRAQTSETQRGRELGPPTVGPPISRSRSKSPQWSRNVEGVGTCNSPSMRRAQRDGGAAMGGVGVPKKKSRSPPRSRIDVNQMPRPRPPTRGPPSLYHTRPSLGTRRVPPSATANFTAVDTGNAGPRYMRVSTVAPPSDRSTASRVMLPLAVVATPFALPESGECEVPLVDCLEYGSDDGNPVRCERCRAYINPHVTWTEGGNKWVCNLCFATNTTAPWYYSSLDGASQRVDRYSKFELCCGSVDFRVSKDYCLKDPQEPVYVFCIDVSPRALASGAASASLDAVRHTLQELFMWATSDRSVSPSTDPLSDLNEGATVVEDEGSPVEAELIRVGIFTFSSQLQFYWVRRGAPEPISMFVVDPEDPFPAIPPSSWLMNLCEQMDDIDILLDRIPELVDSCSDASAPPLNSRGPRLPLSGGHSPGSRRVASTAALDSSRHMLSYSCPTAALKAVQLALEGIGGRVLLLTDSNPDIGFGKIKRKPKLSTYGTPEEHSYYGSLESVLEQEKNLSPEERATLQSYIDLGQTFSNQGTCVDIFFFVPCLSAEMQEEYISTERPSGTSSAHLMTQQRRASPDNSAIFAEICRSSGGVLHLFSGSLHLEDNANRLQAQLLGAVQSVVGSEAVMKLRCSAGFRVSEYYGDGRYIPEDGEVILSGVDRNQTCCLLLQANSSSLKDGDPLCLQLAVLYTSQPAAQRIVRVHTLVVHTSTDPVVIFRHADCDCLITYMCKCAADSALRYPLSSDKVAANAYTPNGSRNVKNVRQRLLDMCIDILLKYRVLCSSHSPKGQLILPEALKVLPLYVLSLLKHPMLLHNSAVNRGGAGLPGGQSDKLGTGCCERAYQLTSMLRMSVRETVRSLYPRLYALHSLQEGDGYQVIPDATRDEEGSQIQMPDWKKCSAESIDSEGVYLLDDGEFLWLYIGRCASQDIVRELLGANPGSSPPASNASPIPPADRKEYQVVESDCLSRASSFTSAASDSRRGNMRCNSSGSIPPALLPRSERSLRVHNIVQCAREDSSYPPELKIVWGGELNSNSADVLRFGIRLIEDSIYGCMSYVDHLCEVHSKIQTLLPS